MAVADQVDSVTFWTRVLSLLIIIWKFVVACIKLAIVVWLIYYFTSVAYPRLFQIGHTESEFDVFMQSYIRDLINGCNTLQASSLPNVQTSKGASELFYASYKSLANVDLAKTDMKNINMNNTDFTLLFVMFKFHYDLKNNKTKNLQNAFENLKDELKPEALVLIKNLYDPKYTKGPKPTYFALDNNKVKQLTALYKSFYDFRKTLHQEGAAIKNDIKEGCPPYAIEEGHVKLLLLDIMTNVYLCPMDKEIKIKGELDRPYPDQINSIERMYRARMSGGGPGPNFALVGLYMDDYQEYIFEEKIKKEIWGQFSSDAHNWMTTIQEAITNPDVAKWIADLPNKMAGEGFVNPLKGDGDVVEHFFGLEKIILAFVYLAQTLLAIINVITDPIGFIKFVIGAILALTLLVLYLFICIITDIIIAPVLGYVGLFFFNVWLTLVLIIFFLIFYLIYFLLAVIDIFTGGIIMRCLRCENRPDAWAFTSNWMRNNRFLRTFFCSRTCNKRYYPSGIMCKKQKKDEPTFTPQQVIYQTWSNQDYISNLKDKIVFSHTPDYDYFANMNDDEKRQLWNNVYDDQVNYMEETQDAFKLYDPMISAMCLQMTSDNNKDISEANKAKIKKLCASCYCVAGQRKKLEFCKTTEQEKTLVQPEKTKKDIVLVIISVLIIIVVAFVIFTLIFSGGNKFTPNTITEGFFEAIHTHNQEVRKASVFQLMKNKLNQFKDSAKELLKKTDKEALEVQKVGKVISEMANR